MQAFKGEKQPTVLVSCDAYETQRLAWHNNLKGTAMVCMQCGSQQFSN